MVSDLQVTVTEGRPLLARILPAEVAVAEAFTDLPDVTLFAQERALVARAVGARRAEFATGRHCARAAMAALGLPAAPILSGPRGEPLWPGEVVGSITHCAGYRAAAVAARAAFRCVGVDAEPHEPLPPGVLDAIARPAERAWARRGAAVPDRGRLLFTMKEAVFKAWYPLTHRPLGFDEAEITVDEAGVFTARLLVPGPVGELTGRWVVTDGLVASAIVVRDRPSPRK